MKKSNALNASRRAAELEQLVKSNDPVDVVVIGGGITGTGIALDAVSRGLKTVLIEKHDLAFGTSRWSSKLAHGGLRYLTKLDFAIAHNSAVERGILMERTAPHLIHALPQVCALGSDTNAFQKAAMRAGFIAGDVLRVTAGTSSRTLPRSHYASREDTIRLFPAVKRDGLHGSWVNYDGQMVDDARVVVAMARTAAQFGASILTRVSADEFFADRVNVTDQLTGKKGTIHARVVINASGVWAASLDNDIKIRPARGTHLVFDAEKLGNPRGSLTVPLPGSISRYLFFLPAQHGRVYLGLTDEDNPGEIPDVPPTPEEDIDFLLKYINRALEVPLKRDDVVGTFTGLRPLIDSGEGGSTADVSRKHVIIKSKEGAYSVVGGKFTEYRLMAQETLDEVLAERRIAAGKCQTRDLPLVGAPDHPGSAGITSVVLDRTPKTIVDRFGWEAPDVLSGATVDRPADVLPGTDVTRAEVEFAVTHEGALSVEDVLERRTRIAMVKSDAEAVRDEVKEIVDAVLAGEER